MRSCHVVPGLYSIIRLRCGEIAPDPQSDLENADLRKTHATRAENYVRAREGEPRTENTNEAARVTGFGAFPRRL